MHLGEATVSPGSVGGDVRIIQQILAGQGYSVGPIDGYFGPQTLAAVKAFQKAKGLVPDGIAGPLTWDALREKTPNPVPTPTRPPIQTPARTGYNTLMSLGLGVVVLLAVTWPRKRRRR